MLNFTSWGQRDDVMSVSGNDISVAAGPLEDSAQLP